MSTHRMDIVILGFRLHRHGATAMRLPIARSSGDYGSTGTLKPTRRGMYLSNTTRRTIVQRVGRRVMQLHTSEQRARQLVTYATETTYSLSAG